MESFIEMLKKSDNIVFFGGAGVSTESGIPDFRSEQGIYKTKQDFGVSPETILSHTFFMQQTQKFYEFYRTTMIYENAKPNKAHEALAKLEAMGKLKAVVTQNIDGLHQAAGSRTVYELHGTVHKNKCMRCGRAYGLDAVMAADGIPRCACGGIIKPDVVLYEESLDEYTLDKSLAYIQNADILIIGGTSLAVYPAASLIHYYRGKKLVLVNKTPTSADAKANLVIHGAIGEIFSQL